MKFHKQDSHEIEDRFFDTIEKYYGLSRKHSIKKVHSDYKWRPSVEALTALLYFSIAIKYPALGLSWYSLVGKGYKDSVLSQALASIHLLTGQVETALEYAEPLQSIRIHADTLKSLSTKRGSEAEMESLFEKGMEAYKSLQSDNTNFSFRSLFDVLSICYHSKNYKSGLDLVMNHRRLMVDETRDLIEECIRSSKKLDSETRLRLVALKNILFMIEEFIKDGSKSWPKESISEWKEWIKEVRILKKRVRDVQQLARQLNTIGKGHEKKSSQSKEGYKKIV